MKEMIRGVWAAALVLFVTGLHAQDDGSSLDFTTGDLETIGPIQAKADKPQVVISAVRVAPEFRKFEIDERNFVQDVLKTANNRELHKKFREKAFAVDVPSTE